VLYLVTITILAIIAAVLIVGAIMANNRPAADGSRLSMGAVWGVVALCGLVLGLTTLAFSFTTVGARSVGVVTSLGKFEGTLGSGVSWTAPWAEVEEFSTQVQYLDLEGEGDRVSVTYAGGGGGSVDATVRWRTVDEAAAEKLWRKYKTFDKVREQLVAASAADSFRVTIAKFTPNEARDGENLRAVSSGVQADLGETLEDDGIAIDSVSVKNIGLDDRAQRALDAVVTANTNIERAQSEQERARIDAETAQIRAAQGALTPEALARYCLEVTNAWNDDENGPLPATWSCFGGQAQAVIGVTR